MKFSEDLAQMGLQILANCLRCIQYWSHVSGFCVFILAISRKLDFQSMHLCSWDLCSWDLTCCSPMFYNSTTRDLDFRYLAFRILNLGFLEFWMSCLDFVDFGFQQLTCRVIPQVLHPLHTYIYCSCFPTSLRHSLNPSLTPTRSMVFSTVVSRLTCSVNQ